MIDAHVQYSGGWKGFLTLNPDLQCEFEDHRTCKELSARIQAEEDGKTQAEKDELAAKLKKQVDDATVFATEKFAQDELNKSGQKKSEAIREINKAATEALDAITTKAGTALAEIAAKAQADTEKASKACEEAISTINAERTAKIVALDSVDWLAKVREEAAAKVDEEAASKVAEEAAAKVDEEAASKKTAE